MAPVVPNSLQLQARISMCEKAHLWQAAVSDLITLTRSLSQHDWTWHGPQDQNLATEAATR